MAATEASAVLTAATAVAAGAALADVLGYLPSVRQILEATGGAAGPGNTPNAPAIAAVSPEEEVATGAKEAAAGSDLFG